MIEKNSEIGIFVFTKDRPHTLEQTLNKLNHLDYRIIIIDDSTKIENSIQVLSMSGRRDNFNYIGPEEYKLFIKQCQIDQRQYNWLISSPGEKGWNLGYMRNLALLLAKKYRFTKVGFMDDDIIVEDPKLFEKILPLLIDYSFVGAYIKGQRDDSLVGHISHELGYKSETLLSGGFMLFSLSQIRHYFLNIYNEDWIWQLLHVSKNNSIQLYEVIQAGCNLYELYKNKIQFQEIGENLLNGLFESRESGESIANQSHDFWQSIIAKRISQLDDMLQKVNPDRDPIYQRILNLARQKTMEINPADLLKVMQNYYLNLDRFHSLFDFM